VRKASENAAVSYDWRNIGISLAIRVLSANAWFQQSAWGIHSHLRRADICPAIRSTKIAVGPDPINQSSHTRIFLPAVAVMIFITMVAIAEYQIRSSPKWPPPPRHEVGGWQVDDPPLWTLAGSVNLPATVPILWMSALSDGFTYALDDHDLIIYVPWTFFVFWLWYFVAYHVDQSANRVVRSSTQRFLVFSTQMFITAELIYFAIGIISRTPADHPLKTPTVVIACFWAWVVATIIGWLNLIRFGKNSGSVAASIRGLLE